MEDGRSASRIFARKPTGKRPLGRPSRRWEHNIRMDLQKIGVNTKTWIEYGIGPSSSISDRFTYILNGN